jgi:hypothetical protein
LFKRQIFKTPLDRQFWWIGSLGMLLGIVLGVASLFMGLNGWTIERLWLYFLAATMLVLQGLQLFIYWIIVRVLEELSQREFKAQSDLAAR